MGNAFSHSRGGYWLRDSNTLSAQFAKNTIKCRKILFLLLDVGILRLLA